MVDNNYNKKDHIIGYRTIAKVCQDKIIILTNNSIVQCTSSKCKKKKKKRKKRKRGHFKPN